MAVFRVEKNSGYTVMSNHHLRNRALSLKAKGLLSQMLSLPEDWDYTLQGLARINRESIDAIRQAIRELEQAGYIQRSRERDEKGRLRGADYVIFELPQPVPASVSPTLENPTLENPTQENPTLENPMQLNKDKLITEKQKKEGLNTDSLPIHEQSPQNASARACGLFFFPWVCFPCRGSTRALTAPAGGSCMVQKQKAAASLQRPIAMRGDASRISKQRVTAACSVLWRIKYLLLPIHLEDSTTPSSLPGSPFGTAPPPGTS